MKKLLILGVLALSSLSFTASLEIPENIDREIRKEARGLDGSDRTNFINWQKRAYIQMNELKSESGIPEDEFQRILDKLHKMYGSNYRKQLQVLPDEINDYKELVKRVEVAVNGNINVDEKTNNLAKAEIQKTLSAVKVPKEVLDIYQKSAQELFPNNYPKQKQYLDICIRDYYEIVKIIREQQ